MYIHSMKRKVHWKDFQASAGRHEIRALYHCTSSENLPGIFHAGSILSRQTQKQLGYAPRKYHGWGKKWHGLANYVCLGFAPPRHIREEDESHAVLRIKTDVLWREGVVFCPCNSARDWYSAEEIAVRDDLESFEALFRSEYGNALKRNDAEILVPDRLSLDMVDAILFLDLRALKRSRWACLKAAPLRFLKKPFLWKRFRSGTR